MQIATLEHIIRRVPLLHGYYMKRAAYIKRRAFIILHHLGLLKPYSFVQWLVTYRCPFHCAFCEASAGHAHEDELTTFEARAFIDDLARMGVRRLIFSGGEPLAREDIFELLTHANSRKLKIGLATNSYYTPARWEQLQHLEYFLYFTSLDGLAESHDHRRGAVQSHERVLRSLALCAERRVPMRMVNTVVDKTNINQLEQLAVEIRHSGATHWRLTPLARVGRAVQQDDVFLERADLQWLMAFIRRQPDVPRTDLGESHTYIGCFAGGFVGNPFFCGAGLTRCAVMPNGDVLGCQQIYDQSYSEGNIGQKPFSTIWKEEFGRFRRMAVPEGCRSCEHVQACQGGCWAEMQLNGKCLKALWQEPV